MRKLLYSCLVLSVCLCLCSCKSSDYKKAMALYEAGEYEQARAAFQALNEYQDIASKIAACEVEIKYVDAVMLMEAGQYEEAIATFESLAGHKDSASKIEECKTAMLEQKYLDAIAFRDSGKFIEAYDSLIALDGYKDSAEQAAAIFDEYNAAKLRNANEGDYVIFGKYEQDGNTSNGAEPIEWLVIGKKDSEITVLSKYALECMPYHTSNEKVSWKTCSLRQWLNSDFMDAAFSADEKAKIKMEKHSLSVDSEEITDDQVYLPTPYLVTKYADNEAIALCKPTAYADASNDFVSCWVWSDTATYVRTTKSFYTRIVTDEGVCEYPRTYSRVFNKEGVRPMMCISIEP